MSEAKSPQQVVFTDKARCRDCYRCLRACPVKAIEMHEGQAQVVASRCLSCGTCVRECPQGAKHYRNDVDRAMRLLAEDGVHCVSIAPSFASVYDSWARERLPSALRQLGFEYVGETAIGAYDVALATAEYFSENPGRAHISSACPAVVNHIELYASDLAPRLTPIVSPMIAHAKRLKARFGEAARVVFIGPCVAKKSEAEREEYGGLVDVVLTFDELQEWLQRAEVDLKHCEESAFDEVPGGSSRFFPVPGGLARTAQLETNLFEAHVRTVSGFAELDDALDQIRRDRRPVLLEPLFCDQGCVNGPGMPCVENRFMQRDKLVEYADRSPGETVTTPLSGQELAASYEARPVDGAEAISDEAIDAKLEELGKGAIEDQLNCGACGYESCRAKAIAVMRGMAEADMCIPRMRQLAERRTDRIIDTSPNGIVILDSGLKIISMNTAFRRMFVASEALFGKSISHIIDPEPFERLTFGEMDMLQERRHYSNYHIDCHQISYALREEEQYVGIFVDTTTSTRNAEELKDLRHQTQVQAKELLDHQVHMAQQIAKLLGETTARGETLVRTLLELAGEQQRGDRDGWRDTYTSK